MRSSTYAVLQAARARDPLSTALPVCPACGDLILAELRTFFPPRAEGTPSLAWYTLGGVTCQLGPVDTCAVHPLLAGDRRDG